MNRQPGVPGRGRDGPVPAAAQAGAVASRGAVQSVVLAHRVPLAKVQTVHCDPASLTSVNLLRVDLEPGHQAACRCNQFAIARIAEV